MPLDNAETNSDITVTPCSPNIGAEISDIDLKKPLSNAEVADLRTAFTDHQVIFFRDQEISFEDHVRLAEYFGPLAPTSARNSQTTDDPRVRKFHYDENTPKVSGDVWHTDQSCAEVLRSAACSTIIRCRQMAKVTSICQHVRGL